MPFGLCNSPGTFMPLMDKAFGDLNIQILLVYLDNILVFGSTFGETLSRLKTVLFLLSTLNLKLMKEPKPARRLQREWKCVKQKHGVLNRVFQVNGQEIRQLILSGSLKDKVLRSVHDDLGHQAVEKTTVLTQGRCYWPGMVRDIAEYCAKCEQCTLAKAGKELHSTVSFLTASKPFEILAIDFTVLKRRSSGIENVLVLTDVFIKFTQAIPTKDQ
ncbi:hypothetical protein ACROYT_G005283 [Oculina patagonica]